MDPESHKDCLELYKDLFGSTAQKMGISYELVRNAPNACSTKITSWLCDSYTMGCPPVRGDNPRAKAYMWTNMV